MKRREFLGRAAMGGGAVLAMAGCRDSTKDEERTGKETKRRAETGSPVHGCLDPRIEVDLSSIGWNLDKVREQVKVPILAVVKANAYGHGLVEVSRYLESRGVHGLMVGKLAEARTLKTAGIRCPVFNFGPFGGEDAEAVLEMETVQSVFTGEVRLLHEAAVNSGRKASVNVHVDTGMNRAGVPVERALAYLEMLAGLSGIGIKGISTTFTEDPEFDKEQLRRFLDVCDRAKDKGINVGLRHAASSAGLFSGPEFRLDMIRPGIALYGYYPNAATRTEDALGLKPALRLVTWVTAVRDLEAGESLSYLRAFRAARAMRVATLGIGYSDGYPPALGGKGFALIRGKSFRILPAVTSNHVMVDVQNDAAVELGDEAVLVEPARGSAVAADAQAELGGTSDYKILIGLNPELPRKYSG